jgi:hypothetical protein
MPWDAAIQKKFNLCGTDPEKDYLAMLVRSKDEAKQLIDDAAHCDVADIPSAVGRRDIRDNE